ncbi:unnamed protein product [Trichogramma brassicae]|uniref:GST N-terminal domain-containing protein n=1 Tax=Trichogramma brassicae TaxID=86971 RepID=A0A6H5IIY4_9HYME|nr:unnamed protein product [Trichogramma brassicae]
MTIDIYFFPPSPPCRAVMMLGRYIGVHFNVKTVNVLKGDQFKPSFKKPILKLIQSLQLNPQHTIPTIEDNGFVLWESRSIMVYLVMKYAKNDSLYPKDPEKRGLVEQRLYFDMGTLFHNIGSYYAVGFDIGRYDNVAQWYERCKNAMSKCGFEDVNEAGANIFGGFYKANLKS